MIIVGGGLCGLAVADRLRRRGVDCLVLEAGPAPRRNPPPEPERFDGSVKKLLQVDEEAWRFQTVGLPYDWIRVRALGGRSLLWGGWCERMDGRNLRDARELDAPWPVSMDEILPFYKTAERLLGVHTGRVSSYLKQINRKLGLDVEPQRCATLPGRQRVLTGLDLPRPVKLRANAVAVRLGAEGGELSDVEVLDTRTHKLDTLRANIVVLCVSPIETARLLLASGIHGESGRVGRGLVDHLVATCIAILPHPAPVNHRLASIRHSALVPRFVNIGRRHRDYRSGFTVEVRGPIALEQLGVDGIRGIGIDVQEAKRLSYCLVNAIGEGHPHEMRSVTLHECERDSLGRNVPVVNLAWSEEQRAMVRDMEETVAAIADALAPAGSRIIQLRDPLRPGGISHEAGTARMGKNPRSGVTDAWGGVYGVRGLYIADASVMPTALDRHPTLTIIALALRTADRLVTDSQHLS